MMGIESLRPYHGVFLSKRTDQALQGIVQLTKKAPENEVSLVKKSVYNCRTSVENQKCNGQD